MKLTHLNLDNLTSYTNDRMRNFLDFLTKKQQLNILVSFFTRIIKRFESNVTFCGRILAFERFLLLVLEKSFSLTSDYIHQGNTVLCTLKFKVKVSTNLLVVK